MPATAPFSLVASASAPEAPYPADTKAKGWRFELDYERIEQSDTWVLAAADMRPWLLMLWMTSWRQVPCGSLPATDELISARLGMEIRQFRANRDILLRGWWLADDGRLYHPVITEQVTELLSMRDKEATRKQAYRDKKNQQLAVQCPAGHELDSCGIPAAATPPEPEPVEILSDVANATSSSPGATHRPKPDRLPACPSGEIVALYHEVLPELPRCRLMPEKRVRAIRKAWAWVLTSVKPDGSRRACDADQALTWFRSYFTRARDNDFLMGRTSRSAGHEGWRCDFDFLLTDRGIKQVVELTAEAP